MAMEELFWPFAGGAVGGAVGAALVIFMIIYVLVMLAIYIYSAIALMAIAKKTKTPNGWLAFIPIANIYLTTQMADVSGWWTVALLVALIPFVGGLLVVAGMVYLWWQICPKVKRPEWWSILLLIPIVNLVLLGVMAWGKN